jgi:esterase
VKLHVARRGQGRPLLLLHGLFGSANNWAPLMGALEGFELIAPDLRNHGRSPHDAEAGLAAMAGDLVELLDGLGLEGAGVLGHSLGGRVAMRLALDHPARVKRLLVADMAPRAYGPLFPEVFAALKRLDLSALRGRAEADAALAASLPDPVLRAFLLSNLMRREDGSFAWKMDLAALEGAGLGDEIKAPAPYAGPALFLRGENSNYVRPQDAPGILALFPAAEIRALPGAGHWLHVEQPAAFAAEAAAFFTA